MDAHVPDDPEADEPQTRKALEILRRTYSNTAEFITALFKEELLKHKLRLVVFDLQDLHAEYIGCQDAHGQGPEFRLRWIAARSFGSYWSTINAMMSRLTSTEVMKELGLHGPCLPGMQPMPNDDPSLAGEAKLLELHWAFLLDLASNRAWSQSFFTVTFPYCMAMIFMPKAVDQQTAQGCWRRVCNTMLSLEEHVAANPKDSDARALLNDLQTNSWQVVREFWVIGRACDWDPANPQLRELAFSLFSGPATTKSSLESCFNFAKDTGRQSRANKMNQFTRWSYACLNPYAKSGGLNTLKVCESDCAYLASSAEAIEALSAVAPFQNASKATLPSECPTRTELVQKWRPAGFLANRHAAAATALATRICRKKFASAGSAWMGCLTFSIVDQV